MAIGVALGMDGKDTSGTNNSEFITIMIIMIKNII